MIIWIPVHCFMDWQMQTADRLYNAMPIEGVQHLVDFMREFENSGDYYAK